MKRKPVLSVVCIALALASAGMYFEWQKISPKLAAAGAPKVGEMSATQSRAAAKDKEASQIQTLLTVFAAPYAGQVSVVAADLDTGAEGSIDPNVQMVSASLYKIFVAYGVYQQIDSGALSLASPLPQLDETVGSCLQNMIEVSD